MTPCSEKAAHGSEAHPSEPVNVWMPELRALPSPGEDR